MLPGLLIILTAFLSSHKTLGFYFWHDDFSTLYGPRVGKCIFSWPYQGYCTIFSLLDRWFNYSAFLYFSLGLLLFIVCGTFFYILARQLFSQKVAVVLCLIFASGYIAAGNFLESYSSITSFLSLSFLFAALALLIQSVKDRLKLKILIIGIAVYVLSVVVLRARSATFFVPAIMAILLFSRKESFIKKAVLSVVILVVHIIFYFIIPLGINFSQTGGGILSQFAQQIALEIEFVHFLQTLSSFLYISGSEYVGGVILLLIAFSIWRQRKNAFSRNILIFSLSWVGFLYLPFALKADWGLSATHRYIIFAYPGILLMWGSFGKKKLWFFASVVVVIFNIYKSNIFFQDYLEASNSRRKFYSELHEILPSIPEGSVLFFDFPPSIANKTVDYFRVGYTSSESALGTEYKVNYKKIKLITQSDVLARELQSRKVNLEKLFTFYYDGEKLVSTTFDLNTTIQDSINKAKMMSFAHDEKSGWYSGENEGIDFKIDNFSPVLPTVLTIKMKASFPDFSLPYIQGCIDCDLESQKTAESLEYLTASKLAKRKLKVESSNTGEDMVSDYIVDDNLATYWLANRQLWFKLEKPVLKFQFMSKVHIKGLRLISDSNTNRPVDFNIRADGRNISFEKSISDTSVNIVFGDIWVSYLEISILETSGGEMPLINEIEIIPWGFKDLGEKDIEKQRLAPASVIKTLKDKEALRKYLSSGVPACLHWESASYGAGDVGFDLFVDGSFHLYTINLPVMGIGKPEFSIGCLNIPVDIAIQNLKVSSGR